MKNITIVIRCACGWSKTLMSEKDMALETTVHEKSCSLNRKYIGESEHYPNSFSRKTSEREIRSKIAGEIKKQFYPLCVCEQCAGSHEQASIVDRIIRWLNNETK